MTQLTPESQIDRCLEDGEKLIWAGRPDTQAFLNGLFKTGFGTGTRILGNPLTRRIFMSLFFGTIIAVSISWIVENGILVVMNFSQINPVYLSPIIALFIFAAFRSGSLMKTDSWNGREQDYVESLTYGITNQRLLILRDGAIEEEFTVVEVNPKLVERKNAPGFSDIIWGGRVWGGSGVSHQRNPSAFYRELNRVGFKALPDADVVLQKIESWRTTHLQELEQGSQEFLNSKEQSPTNGETQSGQGRRISREIKNTSLGFSIEYPQEWSAKVRKRRLAFGKWGIEKEAVWSDEDELSKWNVVCVESSLDTKVEVQVHKIPPINTFDKLVNANTGISGISELIDKNSDFSVNGLKGFYVTRQTGGDSIPIVGQMINIPVSLTRYHIFHDGQRQFYVESTWPKDAPAEAKLCEAIVSTLKGTSNNS